MKRTSHEEAGRWLIQARDEFKDAEDLRQRKRYYIALFHFQQSAEKALKAYLYTVISSEEVFFTHSIYDLLVIALEKDKDFESVKEAMRLDENITSLPGILMDFPVESPLVFTRIPKKRGTPWNGLKRSSIW
jgi:HEPN domain-containing protein